MSLFPYILLAFFIFLSTMVEVRDSAEAFAIRLTKGLAVSFVVSVVQCALLSLGVVIANMLPHYEFQDVNNLIFIGLSLVVALRILVSAFGNNKEKPAFDLTNWAAVISLAVAFGVNLLILGLAVGFKASFSDDCFKMLIPCFLALFFSCYLSIMLGRQKIKIKNRRWLIVSAVFLLVFVLKCAMDY